MRVNLCIPTQKYPVFSSRNYQGEGADNIALCHNESGKISLLRIVAICLETDVFLCSFI